MQLRMMKGIIFGAFLISQISWGQTAENIQIKETKLSENVYMLQGQGGNMTLCKGNDGIFLVDDQFPQVHEKLMTKIKELGKLPDSAKMYVVNSHFHHDHTGGNALMRKIGATVISHENVRKRLVTDQDIKFFGVHMTATPEAGLPNQTFKDQLSMNFNGDVISAIHPGPAHTDGDAFVHFAKANVIATGDIVFLQTYPFIDLDNGGAVAGVIRAVETMLGLCNDSTKVVPGHGALTDKAGLQKYHDMLNTLFSRVSNMVEQGKSLEEIKAAKPTAEFDTEANGFITADKFIEFLYRDATTPN